MDPSTLKSLSSVASIVNTGASAVSSFKSGSASAAGGDAQRTIDYARASQLEQNANAALGVSQQQSHFDLRSGNIEASKALAAAAASGGGATDPTVVNIISQLKGQSEYQALSDLYTGESKAYNLRSEANIARYGGDVAAYKGKVQQQLQQQKALQTITSGASTLANKYGDNSGDTTIDPKNISWNQYVPAGSAVD